MLVYATASDLATWMGLPEPDNTTQLLRAASILVAAATRADIYDAQPSGLPKNDDVLAALRDATCTQAELWAESDVNPVAGAGGLAKQVVSSSIDGASVTTNVATLDAAKSESLTGLCDTALMILRNAGLASSQVLSW